jgi:opacity protein-like surface antigen
MKGIVKGLSALALATAVFAAPAAAQTPVQFGIGGGVTLPLGDFSDGASLGFHGNALVQFAPAGSPVGVRVDGMYQRLSFKDDVGVDGNFQVISGTANAVYTFQTAESSMFHPYLIAGAGAYNVKAAPDGFDSESETKIGVNAGAGFDYNAGGAVIFVEGRFHNVFMGDDSGVGPSNLNMIPITVGVKFGGN